MRLSDLELAKFRYEVVTGDLSQHASFGYWKSHWPELVRSLGSDQKIGEDEFLNQDKATLLKLHDEIVGLHLISYYKDQDFETHPYFREYDAKFLAELRRRHVRKLQALQYFIVSPRFSVANTLVNFGAILAGLSLQHQICEGLDASVTLARSDIPVASLGFKLGFEALSSRTMHNVPVTMLACFQVGRYPKEEVNEWIQFYWSKRQLTNLHAQAQAV